MTLVDYIELLKRRILTFQEDVSSGVSSAAAEGEFFGIVRRAGILEGFKIVKDELERFADGEEIDTD